MSVVIEDIAPACQKMMLTLEKDVLLSHYKKILDNLVSEYNKKGFPGFRPGKVTNKVVEMKLGKDVRDQSIQEAVSDAFKNFISEKKINVLEKGKVDINYIKREFNNIVECEITYEILPTLELLDFSDKELSSIEYLIDDEAKKLLLSHLSKITGDTEETEEAIVAGHLVTCDVVRKFNANDGIKEDNLTGIKIEIGSNQILSAFNEHLPGFKVGDEVEFSYEYPEDYETEDFRGVKADFKVKINKVEQINIVTDKKELCKKIFPNIEEYSDDKFEESLNDKIKDSAELAKYQDMRNNVFEVLFKAHDFPVPPSLIAMEQGVQLKKNPNQSLETVLSNATDMIKKEIILYSYTKDIVIEENLDIVEKVISMFSQENMVSELAVNLLFHQKDNFFLQKINQYILEYLLVNKLYEQAKSVVIEKSLADKFKETLPMAE